MANWQVLPTTFSKQMHTWYSGQLHKSTRLKISPQNLPWNTCFVKPHSGPSSWNTSFTSKRLVDVQRHALLNLNHWRYWQSSTAVHIWYLLASFWVRVVKEAARWANDSRCHLAVLDTSLSVTLWSSGPGIVSKLTSNSTWSWWAVE